MTGPGDGSRAGPGATPDRTRAWTLALVCVAVFMVLLDTSAVFVALPQIQRSLGSDFADVQWVLDAYLVTLAALLLTAGSLADLFGRRRLFLAGMATFTGASLACALSEAPSFLNVARGVQGAGAAILFTTAFALLAQEFPGRSRARALAVISVTLAVALGVGPLVGGTLTEALSWRWIFLVNVPAGAAAMWLGAARLRESRDAEATGVDWAGAATLSAALFALVFALIRGNSEGWSSPLIVGLLVGAGALLVAFFAVELAQRRPMFDVSLLRSRTFLAASIAAVGLHASLISAFLFLALYLENVLDHSALETGLRFLPLTAMVVIAAPLAASLEPRLRLRRLIPAGLALIAAGLILMEGRSPGDGWTALLAGYLVAGLGYGMVNPMVTQAALSVAATARTGMASGISVTCRQFGAAVGVAGLGAVFQSRVETEMSEALAGGPLAAGAVERLAETLAQGSSRQALEALPASGRNLVADAASQATISALNDVLAIAAGVALAGALLTLVLLNLPGRRPRREPRG